MILLCFVIVFFIKIDIIKSDKRFGVLYDY